MSDEMDTPKSIAAWEPSTELAKKLLEACFLPWTSGLYEAAPFADRYDVPVSEVEACFQEFERAGLVKRTDYLGPAGPRPIKYATTPAAWTAREDYLRRRGLRHEALVRQTMYDPKDLVVALAMSRHIFNGRIRGMGMNPEVPKKEIQFYLDGFDLREIGTACDELISERLITQREYSEEFLIDAAPRGEKRWRSEIAGRLHLQPDESILDLVLQTHIKVFYSWQSEYPRSRNKIEGILEKVIDDINQIKGLVRPLELQQATAVGDGAVRIDVQIMQKIREAEIVVADLTTVAVDGERRRLNDNVLVELGYALASKDAGQIVLLAVRRDDLDGGNLAFDIANVHRIPIGSDDGSRGRVRAEMEGILKRKGWLATG